MSARFPTPEDRVCQYDRGWLMHGHPGHTIWVPRDGRWQFSGDFLRPTFTPSINEGACGSAIGHHFFVRDGVVQYLAVPPHSDEAYLDKCCENRTEFYPIPPWQTIPPEHKILPGQEG